MLSSTRARIHASRAHTHTLTHSHALTYSSTHSTPTHPLTNYHTPINYVTNVLIIMFLEGYFLNHWRSQHRNCKEDRIHHFRCNTSPVSYHGGNCVWTNHFVNDFDQPVNFKCSFNGVITGIQSEYSRHHKDRR